MFTIPRPSRSSSTSIAVSFVVRLIEPLRISSPRMRRAFYQKLFAFATQPANCTGLAQRLHQLTRAIHMQPAHSHLWHATTILTVRKHGSVVIGGDGQVSIG